MFFVWFSANLNVLACVRVPVWPWRSLLAAVADRDYMSNKFLLHFEIYRFSTGTVGPTVFGLGIKESFTVIVIVDLMYGGNREIQVPISN